MRKVKNRTLTPFKIGNHFSIRPPSGQAVTRSSGGVMIVPPSEQERLQIDAEMKRYIERKKTASDKI